MIENYKKVFEDAPVDHKILIVSGLAGVVFSFGGAIGNTLLSLGLVSIMVNLFMGALALSLLWIYYYKRNYVIPAYISVLALTFGLFPSLWVLNGGIAGSVPYYFMLLVCFTAIILHKLRYKLVLGIQFLVLGSLLYIDYYYPHMIVQYPSREAKYLDISIAMVLLGMMLFLILVKVMKEYNIVLSKIQNSYDSLMDVNQQLHVRSMTDELTGICNRRYIMEELNNLRSATKDEPISVIMMDIDYFKKINDRYGHAIGDEVLISVSSLMNSRMRRTDHLARFGGEEFFVLLRNTSSDVAVKRADEIRNSVQNMIWKHDDLKVTISCGVYEVEDIMDIDGILNKSDEALYESKETGRNKVSLYRL